jgi:hydroxymethylpyrimidine pyrophosphatase-like HAD family hydrolase
MLEILPEGCSKALGVTKLCEELGIDPKSQLLAIGDAENDVEMLKMASVGVAVGNANDMAKAAADVVVPLTSCEGGAGLTIESVLTAKKINKEDTR